MTAAEIQAMIDKVDDFDLVHDFDAVIQTPIGDCRVIVTYKEVERSWVLDDNFDNEDDDGEPDIPSRYLVTAEFESMTIFSDGATFIETTGDDPIRSTSDGAELTTAVIKEFVANAQRHFFHALLSRQSELRRAIEDTLDQLELVFLRAERRGQEFAERGVPMNTETISDQQAVLRQYLDTCASTSRRSTNALERAASDLLRRRMVALPKGDDEQHD